MGTSPSQGDDGFARKRSAHRGHGNGHAAVRGAVVAQLAVKIVTPARQGSIGAQRKAVLVPPGESQHGAGCQRCAHCCYRNRNEAVRGAVVAKLPSSIPTPSKRSGAGPREHEVVARAAIVVGHKLVGHSIVAHHHHLPLGKIAERAIDETQPRVSHHRQLRAGHGRIVERKVHRAARGGESIDADRND